MVETNDYFCNSNTLFGKLRLACTKEWNAYCNHDFVLKLGDGELPEKCFRHYLEQDYIFLMHFARAYALAVYKSESLADMRSAASSINAILNYEMEIHVKYCLKWGLKEVISSADIQIKNEGSIEELRNHVMELIPKN